MTPNNNGLIDSFIIGLIVVLLFVFAFTGTAEGL
jgi:hypothetical protein